MMSHLPVLARVAVDLLVRDTNGLYIDGTVGCAAHAMKILDRLSPAGRIWGFDWDQEMLARAQSALDDGTGRARFFHAPFSTIGEALAQENTRASGILLDLGLNSAVLDDAIRGFMYRDLASPLDMRMDRTRPTTAADVLRNASEDELERIFHELGEVRRPRVVARAIARARDRGPIVTAGDLVSCLRRARALSGGPAELSRIYQALRFCVNDELGEVDRFVAGVADWIVPEGRLIVISYESLSDRRFKRLHRKSADVPSSFRLLTSHVIRPGRDEIRENPRARSAKLRAMERIDGQWQA